MNPSEQQATTQIAIRPSLLDQIVEEQARVASRSMPSLTPKQFSEREKLIAELREMLVEGVDYGVIPGTDKPTLLLPGAQKVCAYFGYVPKYRYDVVIEDWLGKQFNEPLFFYRLACELEKDGHRVGEGLGSCNSWESKYRFRWVGESEAKRHSGWKEFPTRGGAISEFAFAVDKAETGGKYGKPAAHWQKFRDEIEAETARQIKRRDSKGVERDAWEIDATQYRVTNENFPDIINTVLKIGKKRAYIDATLSATGLSQYFTQDLDDTVEDIDTGGAKKGTQAAADNVADRRIKEETEKRFNGWPPEFAEDIAAIGTATDGSALTSCMKRLQDELIRTGLPEAEAFYLREANALRERIKAKKSGADDMMRTAAAIAREIPRFRAMKAELDAAVPA